ncbi:MAG: SusD/RagB family nutrient-binding outer membrane lipoprotein, partial [Rikenellaceae bacterium]|nr:SusD/RagB family nutrient-binding outer membrane lipoprotein [Rikenellaceae bacterium]
MNYNILKTICLAAFLGIFTASCTGNFDDLNSSKTKPDPQTDMNSIERVGVLIPNLLYLMHNQQENNSQMIDQFVGGQYGGYFAMTHSWSNMTFGSFNPPADWVQIPFNTTFTTFYSNYNKIAELLEYKGYVYAWVNVVKVNVLLRIVDTYGPIPYSKMGEGQFAVPYDSVEEIYEQMLEELTESIAVLQNVVDESSGETPLIGEYDYVYGGDFRKWIAFANTMKLRLAVRIAHLEPELAREAITEAVASGPLLDNGYNAYLTCFDNPYRKAAQDWEELAINATLDVFMNGWEDPRRSAYMTRTADGDYLGVRMGISGIDKSNVAVTAYSRPNFEAASPIPVMCAAETYFLLAEIALKGLDGNGADWTQAEAYYETGIQTSMNQHNVAIGSYLSGTANPRSYSDPNGNGSSSSTVTGVTVAWSDGASTEDAKLEKIITQKWLAMYPVGFEAWSEFRRTGYPQMVPANSNLSSTTYIGSISNTKSRLVRRLPDPPDEYSGNSETGQYAVDTWLGGQDLGSRD